MSAAFLFILLLVITIGAALGVFFAKVRLNAPLEGIGHNSPWVKGGEIFFVALLLLSLVAYYLLPTDHLPQIAPAEATGGALSFEAQVTTLAQGLRDKHSAPADFAGYASVTSFPAEETTYALAAAELLALPFERRPASTTVYLYEDAAAREVTVGYFAEPITVRGYDMTEVLRPYYAPEIRPQADHITLRLPLAEMPTELDFTLWQTPLIFQSSPAQSFWESALSSGSYAEPAGAEAALILIVPDGVTVTLDDQALSAGKPVNIL